MTKLTTHVLDVYSGKPGKGIKVDLYYISNDQRDKINSVVLIINTLLIGLFISKEFRN